MTETRPRPTRAEPREIVELKQLAAASPDLAGAVEMQIALVDVQRRVQSRVPVPRIQVNAARLEAACAEGRPLVAFDDIPIEWTDFRLMFRQTADILRRYDFLEADDHDYMVALGRAGNAVEPLVTSWYVASAQPGGSQAADRMPAGAPAALDQVLVLALRPFLARCAEVLAQTVDLAHWSGGHCPCCGWEPDFAVIMPSAERRLVCGRCLAQWPFPAHQCPFCGNDDAGLTRSFATRDGRYRVSACDACRRYVKAYDARNAARPVIVSVDSIATLPLDAAAMQYGYVAEAG